MSTLGSLVVDISANVARFQSDMGKVTNIAETAMARVQQTSEFAATALKTVGGALAAAFAVDKLKEFASGVIEATAHLNDLAIKTGASVENLSALQSVARVGGRDFETITNAMVKLNKGLAGTDEETKGAAEGIQRLGLNLADFKKLDAAQQTKAIAEAMSKFADDTNKSALAVELWGKTGAENLPFIRDLAEAGDLVSKVTKQQAEEAEKYEKNIRAMSIAADALKRNFVLGLIPALTDISSAMREAQKESGTLTALWVGLGGLLAKSTVGQFFNLDGSKDAINLAKKQSEEMQRLGHVIEANQALADRGDERAKGIIERTRARLEVLSKQALATTDALKKTLEPPPEALAKPSVGGPPPKAVAPVAKTAGETFIEQLQRQVTQMERGKFAMLELEAAQKNVSAAAQPYIDKLKQAVVLAQHLDAISASVADHQKQQGLRDQADKAGNDLFVSIVEQTEALGLNDRALKQLTATRQIDLLIQRASKDANTDTLVFLNELSEKIKSDVIGALDALEKKQEELNASFGVGATRALDAYAKAAQDRAKYAENVVTGSLSRIEDALVNFVKTGKLSFKDLFSFMAEEYLRQQIRMQISQVAGGNNWAGIIGTIGSVLSGSYDVNYSHEGIHAANGVSYVPRDGMQYTLHEGEKVLTKQENSSSWKAGQVINITSGDTNVGQGVSRGEMLAAQRQGNAELETRIRRLMRNGNL